MKAEDNGGIREESERDTDRTDKSAAAGSNDIGNKESTLSASKYVGVPINELDLSECVQCTPSYRLLPKDVSATLSLVTSLYYTAMNCIVPFFYNHMVCLCPCSIQLRFQGTGMHLVKRY